MKKLTKNQLKCLVKEEYRRILIKEYAKEFELKDTGETLRILSDKVFQLENEVDAIKSVMKALRLGGQAIDSGNLELHEMRITKRQLKKIIMKTVINYDLLEKV